MGKVLDFDNGYKSSLTYQKQLKENIENLDKFDDELYSFIINTATKGKWKKWSDSKDNGTIFRFTEDMLRNTGDENVDILFLLMDQVFDAKEKLEKALMPDILALADEEEED